MPRDGCGVNVVLPEWPDEGLGWRGYRCCHLVSQRQLVPCRLQTHCWALLRRPHQSLLRTQILPGPRSGRLSSKTHWWGPSPILLGPCPPTHTVRALETTSSLKQGERPHINKGDPVNLAALEPLLLEAAFCLSEAAKWSLPGMSRPRQGSPECIPLPSSDWLQGGQGGAR